MSRLTGQVRRSGFAFGCLALSLAIYAITLSVPTGYELSIYAGPPRVAWGLLLISMLISIVLVVYGATNGRRAGLVLSTGVVLTITSAPLLRSYEFFGRFDGLNHLGLVKDMLADVSATTTIYPATHLLSATIVRITGLSASDALMMATPIFMLLFVCGFYSIATRWGTSPVGKAVITLVPMTIPFIIPVRLPKLQPAPTNLALMMFPVLLYLLFNSLRSRRRFTICLLILASSHVLYHPQWALVLAVGIFIGNAFIFIMSDNTNIARPRFGLPVYVGVLITAWLYTKPSFWGAVENVLVGLQSDTGVVEGATPSGTSLSAVGGSLFEVGLKTFASKLLLIAVLIMFGIYTYVKLNNDRALSKREIYVFGFIFTVLPFAPIFAVSVARSQMFRYVGATVLFTVIFLAIYNSERTVPNDPLRLHHVAVILLFLSAVTMLPIAYKSPYVYQPTDHVTQGDLDGHEFVFTHEHERPLRALGTTPDRYRNALFGSFPPQEAQGGAEINMPLGINITERNLDETNGTFLVTEYTRKQYIELYPEIPYFEEDFSYLETGPGINKLYTNGGMRVYSS